MALDPGLVAQIPETLTYDDDGRAVPIRDHPFIKEAKDWPTFVEHAFNSHCEVGARIPVKIKGEGDARNNEIVEWKKNHLPKLYDQGILPRPSVSPNDYDDVVKRPETLPDGWGWNDDFAKEFKQIAHEEGIPKSAISKLIALHEKTLTGAGQTLKTSVEAGEAALKAEHGVHYEERREAAKRLTDHIFKTPEELALFNDLGLGNHPGFLNVLMRLAPLAQQDSSFFTTEGTQAPGAMTREDVLAEVSKIASDKAHPMHAGYFRNDPKVMEYIEGLYKKAYPGDKKVEIT